ncbi:MAG: hypothetical protein J7K87_01360 [Candidatus Aenigmarchaeota archaeon]|nr:hypothetical protein [Candidatus Aenigmarchaeota archaeon]
MGIMDKVKEAAKSIEESASKTWKAGAKDDIIAGEIQKIMTEHNWSLIGSRSSSDYHYYKYSPPAPPVKGQVKIVEISVARRANTIGVYGIPIAKAGPNTVYIRIVETLNNGLLGLILGNQKRSFNFSLDADQYVNDNMVVDAGLKGQLETFLKSAGLI